MKNNIMIDIETLADTNNAVIVSIGAVRFDIETGKTFGDDFYKIVNIDSCLKNGFEVTGGTIRWWMDKSDGARSIFKKDGIHIALALHQLGEFIKKDDIVWSNGLRFDVAILENAYRKLELPVPWQHRNERDVRTLVSFNPKIKSDVVNTWNKVLHNAIDDCYMQIKYCTQIHKTINIS